MTEIIRVFDSMVALKPRLTAARKAGHRIALVPTMGNLHAGHMALVDAARAQCDFLLTTIFINPMQFGPNEDFERYPRTFEDDVSALQGAACDAVYVPSVDEIYPNGVKSHARVTVPSLAKLHCGKTRPGHFDGVSTVVNILLNMIQPSLAVFGLKDYQQFCIIRKMVRDLHIRVQLKGIPTVREESGLALSSRNSFLSTADRARAISIHATLQYIADQVSKKQKTFRALEKEGMSRLEQAGLRPEYFNICNRNTLLLANDDETEIVILVAAHAGSTRLIDNIIL